MNVTIALDEELVRRARVRALQEHTSLNAVIGDFLQSYAGTGEQRDAVKRLLRRARSSRAGSGEGGRTWTRESLYEERFSRHGRR